MSVFEARNRKRHGPLNDSQHVLKSRWRTHHAGDFARWMCKYAPNSTDVPREPATHSSCWPRSRHVEAVVSSRHNRTTLALPTRPHRFAGGSSPLLRFPLKISAPMTRQLPPHRLAVHTALTPIALLLAAAVVQAAPPAPHPTLHPESPVMLAGAWLPDDTQRIDFDKLPRAPSQHAIVSSVRAAGSSPLELDHKNGGVNQHNYLAHYHGKFWAMWSDGPGIEDRAGQRVKFATSADGLQWSEPAYLTPVPRDSGPDSPHFNRRSRQGFRYIARGFWKKRDGELLALASLDEAAEFFGASLELRAFRLNEPAGTWDDAGLVFKDAINNFPPLKLRTGDWMMSRRMHDYRMTGVHFLVGGVKGLDQWESFPVLGTSSTLKAEEPEWWVLPDQNLQAMFRDNNGSGFLYRAFSTDDGRTWSPPVKTNFPDATSKISGLRLSDGRYALVSNPRPRKRDPLTLSISKDGMVFTKMLYLVGERWIDYPHIMEHDGHLFIAFAGGKQSVEVLKVSLREIDTIPMPSSPLLGPPLPKPEPKPKAKKP